MTKYKKNNFIDFFSHYANKHIFYNVIFLNNLATYSRLSSLHVMTTSDVVKIPSFKIDYCVKSHILTPERQR